MEFDTINSKEKNINNLRARIDILYDIKKLELLIEEGKKLLSIEPEDKYALNMIGLAYEKLGKLEEAEAVALSYLELYPNDADGHALYGKVLHSKENYEQATVEYKKAIELEPMDSYLYYRLAINLFIASDKNINQSIELVQHALELNPNDAIIHAYLGEQYKNAGRLEDSRKECIKALELGPDIAIVHWQYGSIQMHFGNFNEAEEHVMESLRINPIDKVAQNTLKAVQEYKNDKRIFYRKMIKYYMEFENVMEAENITLNYITEYPNDGEAHSLYGKILFAKQNHQQAIEEFMKAIELDDGNEYNYLHLAMTLNKLDKKNTKKPIELMIRALKIARDKEIFSAFLGYLYLEEYNFEAAEKECLKALEIAPTNAYVLAQWGQIQLFTGNIDEARKNIEEAVRLDPGEKIAQNILKNMEAYESNMKLYLRHMIYYHSRCLRKHPENAKGHLILSKMYLQKENIKKAINELKKYLALKPQEEEECMNFARLMSEKIGERKVLMHFKSLHKQYPNNEAINHYMKCINGKIDLGEAAVKENKKTWVIIAIVFLILILAKFLS